MFIKMEEIKFSKKNRFKVKRLWRKKIKEKNAKFKWDYDIMMTS